MATTNPLWMVHNSIWTTLEASSGFTTLVAQRRRLKDTEADWVNDTHATSDGPNVRVLDRGDQVHIQRTSDGSSIVMRMEIQVSTTSQKYESVCDVRWAILRAMCNWESYIKVLTWSGSQFVRDFRFVQSESSNDNRELNRGIKGWSTVCLCEVEMWFATADLQP